MMGAEQEAQYETWQRESVQNERDRIQTDKTWAITDVEAECAKSAGSEKSKRKQISCPALKDADNTSKTKKVAA